MDPQRLIDYCANKPGVTQNFPFDEYVLTFRVMGKIFALINMKKLDSIALKCEPLLAEALRRQHPEVTPGYHLNKTHWNSVALDGALTEKELFPWIDLSYKLVAQSLKKADREALAKLANEHQGLSNMGTVRTKETRKDAK